VKQFLDVVGVDVEVVRMGTKRSKVWRMVVAAALAASLAACGGDDGDGDTNALKATLGDRVFHDVSLSASGRQSCSSCHVAGAGHAQDNALAAQLGGANLNLQGLRVAPSIRYLSTNTAFHFDEEDTPTGGFFWDGRAASLAEQAGQPFLNPVEMAMPSKAAVVAQVQKAAYAATFRFLFGEDIFERVDDAFAAITEVLQVYQLEDPEFRPFSSKYDAYLRGRVALSDQEARGLALFNDPAKGNCAACHPSERGADGAMPLFTDFSYDNLGVPRNPEIAANADPAHFDLGLCARPDGLLAARTDLCGAFKVPSLRNVALRQAYFHNGRFKTLKDALTFYVQRDTNPEKFYPRKADNSIDKFDDLPLAYKANVNTSEAPYDRQLGDAPALSDAEIDDVIAFLKTLSDGWKP
jgi:cytochrome c peroxidase